MEWWLPGAGMGDNGDLIVNMYEISVILGE